ncbi:hypothetical protein SAMN06295970_114131 [Noviherbaspirillum suwonense]|jgi:hypothetical protein|uniref:DNA-binding protein n=2 Tax=Noviherbaspirillum suwonense TaxID=1224511 RepID=A0ABY1QGZ7_9BURK|nr:hypothetical protein SAMN06295970_114131 [Noviherbaspirillum suwonense]
MRLGRLLVLLLVVGGLAFWTYGLGRGTNALGDGISAEEADRLKVQAATARAESEKAASVLSTAENQLAMEKAAHQQLAAQVQSLTAENARLEEDLAFFDSLLPSGPASEGLSIRRLKIELLPPNQLRYRLLVMRRGNNAQDFKGSLSFSLAVTQSGKPAVLSFPGKEDKAEPFQLEFRRYQRIEGILTLPDGVQVKNAQARVLENGKVRVQQSATM